MNKIEYPIDKRSWHPGLIPGPIVLVSTCDEKKKPNIAPKSWVQMVSFEPPILMFSGTKGNTTEVNILQTGCFGVNIVDATIASRVFGCIQWYGLERIKKAGFSLVTASKIEAPLVAECRAHLECRLHRTSEIGSGFVVFGEIVAASIWDRIAAAASDEQYALLEQIVFLENNVYSVLNRTEQVDTNRRDQKQQ